MTMSLQVPSEAVILLFCLLIPKGFCDQTPLPPGYYAFETASRRHGVPPRVRPPPYLPTDVPCPGGYSCSTFLSFMSLI